MRSASRSHFRPATAIESVHNQRMDAPFTLFGRSSSHYTRIPRVFAAELGVEYRFHVVSDLTSLDRADYGDNPALKVPVLVGPRGTFFGAMNACRELERASERKLSVLWPEACTSALLANAQELVLHAMSVEVTLIMAKTGPAADSKPSPGERKLRASLGNSLGWLETHWAEVLSALPSRDLSFLEVSAYCLLTHLPFRKIASVDEYASLSRFAQAFGERESARATPFRFDAPAPA